MRTVLITLIGPEHTSDLVVDADTPVRLLLPSLLSAAAVPESQDTIDDWTLAVTGKQPVAPEDTLEQAGVLDGALLVLRRTAGTTQPRPPVQRAGASTAPGSPLARTRDLLSDAPRRRVLGAPVPDAALGADARIGALEHVVSTAGLTRCATIAVVSPKGGVGKTTLSILLGETLSGLRSEHVLALDGDSDYGSLGRVGEIAPARSRTHRDGDEIFQSLKQGAVTFAELDRTLWALPGGLRIVPSPRHPTAMAQTDRAAYTRVVGNLQRLAGVLIVDCGTGLGQPGVQAAILACDQLILVTDASGATASLAVEAFALLERTGRPITVVANRLRRGRAGDEELARLDASFTRASGLVGIAEDPEAARTLGGDLDLSRAARGLRRSLLELAATLATGWSGLGAPAPRPDRS